MTFAYAVQNSQVARTTNGMKAQASTANPLVDFFYNAGAMRGKDILPIFAPAYAANPELALRISAWLRDVRGGAGERKLFRDIIKYLEVVNIEDAARLLFKAPDLGRWDDVIETPQTAQLKEFGFMLALEALQSNNKLTAKWMPRKGPLAKELREFYGLSPRDYRKALVAMTEVVETQMCAKQWNEINFSHVPSLAHSRYKKAFLRNAPEKYADFGVKLEKGEDKTVKVNAGAVYPYDILKGSYSAWGMCNLSATEVQVMEAQWKAQPNYLGEDSVLALVDTSQSMGCPAGGYGSNSGTTCLEVAVSLGLYCADKLTGAFKDLVLIFSSDAKLHKLTGNSIINKANQLRGYGYQSQDTNLHSAFDKILQIAKQGSVSDKDMPKMLLIMSDMQFNSCVRFDDSAYEMIARKYEAAGYTMPKIVFWNLNSSGNAPASSNASNVGLVSGFSPSIMKSVLSAKDFTPYGIMLETIMKERYDV